MLVLEFDHLPPTSNHAFTVNKYNHRIIPTTAAQKYMAYAKEVTESCKGDWIWQGTWIRLLFQIYIRTNVYGDLSNYKKILEDGIAKGLNVNDKYFLWHDNVPILDRTQESRVVITISQDETQGVLGL